MQIGIFSDVHDNIPNLKRMLAIYAERGIDSLIFCGDFCSPIPAREMGSFDGEIHCVFGNGDGDRFTILQVANSSSSNLRLHGELADLNLDGVKVAVTHYPFYAKPLARTGDYQAVFSGHTHVRSEEKIGDCLWLNPGEVMGWKGEATCAVYDTRSNGAELLFL